MDTSKKLSAFKAMKTLHIGSKNKILLKKRNCCYKCRIGGCNVQNKNNRLFYCSKHFILNETPDEYRIKNRELVKSNKCSTCGVKCGYGFPYARLIYCHKHCPLRVFKEAEDVVDFTYSDDEIKSETEKFIWLSDSSDSSDSSSEDESNPSNKYQKSFQIKPKTRGELNYEKFLELNDPTISINRELGRVQLK